MLPQPLTDSQLVIKGLAASKLVGGDYIWDFGLPRSAESQLVCERQVHTAVPHVL